MLYHCVCLFDMFLRLLLSNMDRNSEKIQNMNYKMVYVRGMSSENEPTWRTCRKAVWMIIQNFNNLAEAEDLLNRQENDDLHVTIGKCFILLLTAVQTLEKSRVERALAECRRLEARCGAAGRGGGGGGGLGWMTAVRRRLFPSAAGVDEYDAQIALADVTACMAGLTVAAHRDSPSVTAVARSVYALRRASKMYQQCYAAVLDAYRAVYDLDPDQNTPRWPPVLKRRQSVVLDQLSNIGSRMLRSATTSFEIFRQTSVPNMIAKDVVRLMAAVSLGYGTFNLMVSLLPPTIASVFGMFGFCGNRQVGLDALAFAKNGPDVHAPLAWGILAWYHMMGNTDFMFDGPLSRENESYINDTEQLVCNPPDEFRDSTTLQYFTGRSCYLKGDIEGSIRAYEIGLTIVECCFINMKAMFLHELGFMYAIRLDWMVSCRKFAYVAGDNTWMRPYHYFMATVCAGAAGDTATAELMSRRVSETIRGIRWSSAERDMVGSFVADRWRAVAKTLRRTTETTTVEQGDGCGGCGDDNDDHDHDDRGSRRCRLIVYEVLYVKYGAARWPADVLRAVLADCRETEDDDDTTRYTKRFLTIVCRRVLGYVGDHCRSLVEFVEHMDRDKRRDHLYVYGLYELAIEQLSNAETVNEGKRTIQKLNDVKGPYHFQYFYVMRCNSLQMYAQKLNVR